MAILNPVDLLEDGDQIVRALALQALDDPTALGPLSDRLEELGESGLADAARNRLLTSDIKSIQVVGRRWFGRRLGGTLHTADIYVNRVLVHTTQIDCGYGDQYVYTAFEWLKSRGLIPDWQYAQAPRRYCEEHDIAYTQDVYDVPRKRDL